ncbi:MAG TPA: hypothetical protein ENH10_07285 [Bacteroidetes bacterium]|nr:hypothetical protein BMS3Bbin04_00263 [bacterium BMS3Bbin04]HDO65815.1 hypothetical protein [Bacteroidota bacterium]HEX04940.1 hypothetical protein [Bacteroidota bacterium]
MKRANTAALMLALLITLLIIGGCASGSKMTRTEEGYKPTHVVLGDVVAYTQGVAQVSTSDVKQVISDELEMAFRQQGLSYVSLRELETTPVPATDLVKLNATVTFQQGASDIVQSIDARYNYDLVRVSDGFLWQEGSAKTTDWTVSQGATMDVLSALKFGAQATVREVKELME